MLSTGFTHKPVMTPGLKILNVVAARPNLPKIAPRLREIKRHPEITAIWSTPASTTTKSFRRFLPSDGNSRAAG